MKCDLGPIIIKELCIIWTVQSHWVQGKEIHYSVLKMIAMRQQ